MSTITTPRCARSGPPRGAPSSPRGAARTHTDDGVEVRRAFHHLRSHAIETFNEQFKAIFDVHGPVPTKGLVATQRHILGAIVAYQLLLLHRFERGQDLRAGLKARLRAA